MSIASVKLTEKERAFLERLVKEGRFESIIDALKAGIHELMRADRMSETPWKTCREVRESFSMRERKVKGLEQIHEEL